MGNVLYVAGLKPQPQVTWRQVQEMQHYWQPQSTCPQTIRLAFLA